MTCKQKNFKVLNLRMEFGVFGVVAHSTPLQLIRQPQADSADSHSRHRTWITDEGVICHRSVNTGTAVISRVARQQVKRTLTQPHLSRRAAENTIASELFGTGPTAHIHHDAGPDPSLLLLTFICLFLLTCENHFSLPV